MLAKIEGRNPSYSVKCRIGAAMIWDAEEKGIPHPEIIEPTSGNTGIGSGLRLRRAGLQIDPDDAETMSMERRKVSRVFRSEHDADPGTGGHEGSGGTAEELAADFPSGTSCPSSSPTPRTR